MSRGKGVRKPVVAIVYRYVPRYRAPFYEDLRSALEARGVELRLVVGQPTEADQTKGDAALVAWATPIRNRCIPLGSKRLIWQPALKQIADADLVIVEQATRLILNYVLLARRTLLGSPLLAYWGHGANFQKGEASRIAEWLKPRYSTRADWWFAYNDCSAAIVEGYGYPRSRITVVQNAIDDEALRSALDEVTASDLDEFRRVNGITGRNVCAFVGSMYPDKRIGFLLEAAALVRSAVPDFELLLVGTGPDADVAREAAASSTWIHMLGTQYDQDRATAIKASKLLLVPGAVGLVALDSFVAGVPLVTAVGDAHGPEFDYLDPGVNSIVVDPGDSVESYARETIACLTDKEARHRMRDAALAAGEEYTLKGMVERFANGVTHALKVDERA